MKWNNNQPIDFLIKTTWHSIQRMYAEMARQNGITQAMGFVLISIDKQGSTPSEISKKIGVKSISLTRVLNDLERRSLITRNADIKDARKVILKLTDEGVIARKVISKIINDFNDLLNQRLSNEEKKALEKITFIIESLTESLSEKTINQNKNT
jgi:DNA-binding MarR family transcriptional regulator